jgi:hypothetical protein
MRAAITTTPFQPGVSGQGQMQALAAPAAVQISPFDNEVTLLYKWAGAWSIPVRLILIRERQPNEPQAPGTRTHVFEPLSSFIQRQLAVGQSLNAIYEMAKPLGGMTVNDFAMTYFSLQRDNPQINTAEGQFAILAAINQFYGQLERTNVAKFQEFNELIIFYDSWVPNIQAGLRRDVDRLAIVQDIQADLHQLTSSEVAAQYPVLLSPVTIGTTSSSFEPLIATSAAPNGRKVVPEDGLDIFNNSTLSVYVPYLQYNSQTQRYYKIYKGTAEKQPDFDIIISPPTRTNDADFIYFTLWLGDDTAPGTEMYDAPAESFYHVNYDLQNNVLTVKTPSTVEAKGKREKRSRTVSEAVALQRIQSTLPLLRLQTGREFKVTGDFTIWNTIYDETVLLDMILTNELFDHYLYVEESTKPAALKKRLRVRYRSLMKDEDEGETMTLKPYITNFASVSLTMSQHVLPAEQLQTIIDPSGQLLQYRLPANTPYIQFKISQADSQEIIAEFIRVFVPLFRYYLINAAELQQEYLAIIPELAQLPGLLAQRDQTSRKAKSPRAETPRRQRLKDLQAIDPEMFPKIYSRSVCTGNHQPIIITPEEAPSWQARGFIKDGVIYQQRQILAFPRVNPKHLIVCPDDEIPFPGVKPNTRLPNKGIYPYLPCCYVTDQMSDPTSDYSNYMKGLAPQPKKGTKTDSKTKKILDTGYIGSLPVAVQNLFANYMDADAEMKRFGVPRSPNALIHCALIALASQSNLTPDDPRRLPLNHPVRQYITLPNDQARELFAQNIRLHIAQHYSPDLFKQELFDRTDEEITALLRNPAVVLEPYLFYRGVEEFFGINIYVFAYPKGKKEKKLGEMEVPRHRLFHCRPFRNTRQTMIVIRNWGSESDNLAYPHVELVVDYNKTTRQSLMLFGTETTKLCQDALREVLRTITWVGQDVPSAHQNIYYEIDYRSVITYPALSQIIDSNGKAQAFIFQIKGVQVGLVVPPSQPENLPVVSSLPNSPLAFVLENFEQPTGFTRNDGLVTGVWFQIMDIKYGVYIPVVPVAYNTGQTGLERRLAQELNIAPGSPTGNLEQEETPPSNPLAPGSGPITQRLRKMRRTVDFILQLVDWLYELVKVQQGNNDVERRLAQGLSIALDPRNGGLEPPIFANNYLITDTRQVIDSANYYDLSRLPRLLPTITDKNRAVELAIEFLAPQLPTLFTQGRMVMYSQAFRDKIVAHVWDYQKRHFGLPGQPASFIQGYFVEPTDFKQQRDVIVFIGETDLKSWLISVTQSFNETFGIRVKVDLDMSVMTEPYIYQSKDGRIYLIQNVVGADRRRALQLGKNWYDQHINTGYATPPGQLYAHLIYGIAPDGVLVPDDNQTQGSPLYINILRYQKGEAGMEGRYAAMLDLIEERERPIAQLTN